MNKPQAGYYRNLLRDSYPEVRIAFTSSPIIGCRRVDAGPVIEELKKSTDPYAEYYISGLQNGLMATIIELNSLSSSKVWQNNGELYFRS